MISLFVPSAGGSLGGAGAIYRTCGGWTPCLASRHRNGSRLREQVADMIQPFWALPVVAVAGISIRRVMGFTVMSFILGVALFGAAY